MTEHIMPAVGIDINLFWQIINFIILIFVFKMFFHKPMQKFLATRQEKISEELTQAAKDKEDAAKEMIAAGEVRKEAKAEAHRLVTIAEKKAEEKKEVILKETHAMREKMIATAEADIAKMKAKASKELQVEATKIAVILAEKMINEKMNPKLGENLLDQFIDEVGDSK